MHNAIPIRPALAILGAVLVTGSCSHTADVDAKLRAHDWSCVREDGGDNGTFAYAPGGIAQIFTINNAGARTFRTFHYSVSDHRISYTWEEDGGGAVTVDIEVLSDSVLSTHQISGRARGKPSADFTTVGPVGATRSHCTAVPKS